MPLSKPFESRGTCYEYKVPCHLVVSKAEGEQRQQQQIVQDSFVDVGLTAANGKGAAIRLSWFQTQCGKGVAVVDKHIYNWTVLRWLFIE